MKEKYFAGIFNVYPFNSFFRQNWVLRMQSWGPDASLYTYIDAIVDPGHQYWCRKKCLGLRTAASEADFVQQWKIRAKILFHSKFWKSFVYFGLKWRSRGSTNQSPRTTKIYMGSIQVYENEKTPPNKHAIRPTIKLFYLIKMQTFL